MCTLLLWHYAPTERHGKSIICGAWMPWQNKIKIKKLSKILRCIKQAKTFENLIKRLKKNKMKKVIRKHIYFVSIFCVDLMLRSMQMRWMAWSNKTRWNRDRDRSNNLFVLASRTRQVKVLMRWHFFIDFCIFFFFFLLMNTLLIWFDFVGP